MTKEYMKSFSPKSVKYLKERLEEAVTEGFLKKEEDKELEIEAYKQKNFCYLLIKYLEDGRANTELLVSNIKNKEGLSKLSKILHMNIQ